MEIVLLLLWAIIGIVNLLSGGISKASYGFMWFAFMLVLIANVMKG